MATGDRPVASLSLLATVVALPSLASYIHSIAYQQAKVKRKIPALSTPRAKGCGTLCNNSTYVIRGISEFSERHPQCSLSTGACTNYEWTDVGFEMMLAASRGASATGPAMGRSARLQTKERSLLGEEEEGGQPTTEVRWEQQATGRTAPGVGKRRTRYGREPVRENAFHL